VATNIKFIFTEHNMEASHRAALQKANLFEGIKPEECNAMLNCFSPQVKHFSKNETIFFTGDSVKHLGIILFGTAHAYLEHIDGNQTIMANLTPGRVFGEILVSTRTQQSPVTIRAVTDATAAFIEYQKVYSMCAAACTAHRIFLQNMLRVIGDKYFYLFDRINILREKSLRSRIKAYLYSLSDNGKIATVTIPFTKTILADYLLANRSALSKDLSKMEREGIISVNGRNIELYFLNGMNSTTS